MKLKKILFGVLAIAASAMLSVGVAACKNKDESSSVGENSTFASSIVQNSSNMENDGSSTATNMGDDDASEIKCVNYTLSVDEQSASVTGYTGSPTKVKILSTYQDVPVVAINGFAFADCSSLTSVEIPDSVTSIGDYAFKNCSALKNIEIPDGVTSIGKSAFYNCVALTSAEIGNNVISIGKYAFYNCNSLTSVEIPDGVTNISERTFYNCSSLTNIKIPDSVTSIGESAFYNCSSLTNIKIPDSVTSIGDNAFYNCSGLTSNETDNVVDITENTADTQVTLSVTDGYVLDIRVIYNLENHGGCTSVDWGDGTSTAIAGKTDDEMKHKYATADTYTITLCGLKVMPRAFVDKKVSYVAIGSTLETIDDGAFLENPDLTEVRIYAENPPKFIDTMQSSDSPFGLDVKTIYVPEKSIQKYVEEWADYASVFQTDGVLSTIFADTVVTVGVNGDFPTINKALTYLSAYYPVYKKGGLDCEIKILDGTIIDEQIIVERLDLSYITITTDNAENTVTVTPTTANWDKSTLTHDTRGNVPLFGGEYGARLPVIKCLFSTTSPTVTLDGSEVGIVGYYCNRGSTGVIAGETINGTEELANIGFEGFYDNIIANNNSEIVLREAIARNAVRYGVMSRHISRVSARSADITGCKECAAYTDRASMMDVRHADLSGSKNGIQAYNASVVTANATTANNITGLVADSQTGSTLNAESIDAQNSANIFSVSMGGQIIANNAKTTGATGTIYNVTTNTLTADGVIFN